MRAAAGFYQARWTAEILDEGTRNLVGTARMTEAQATRLRSAIETAFPEAEIDGYQDLVASMKNDAKDRHVAAAAVKAGAQVIVTANLKDFVPLPDGVEAKKPDDFLCDLFDLEAEGFVELLREQAQDLQRPPVTFEELLFRLESVAPRLVALVRQRAPGSG